MEKFFVTTKNSTNIIEAYEVLFVQARGSYSIITMRDGSEIKVAKNLKHILESLRVYDFFIRVQRSWVVNTNAISAIKNNPQNGKSIITVGQKFNIPTSHCLKDVIRLVKLDKL